VVEGAIGRLQEAMRDKRNTVRQLEESLEGANPQIFQLVQVRCWARAGGGGAGGM
jgi:hypothetical protein